MTIVATMATFGSRYRFPSWMRWAVAALAAMLMVSGVGAVTETQIRSIDIVHDSDAYVANVVVFAPVPTSVAWEVLTDFDHMADWVPNVRESKVISRELNALTVEQHGVAKFGITSFPYSSVRQMQLDPQRTVRSTQITGTMRRDESLTTLTADRDGTQLTYHLEVVPTELAATVMSMMSKDFLAHELGEQFSAIIGEMLRRHR